MSNKMIIVLVGVFFVMILIMGGGFFFMWSQINQVNAQNGAPAEKEEEPAALKPMGPIFPLETFIVNLADEGGNRYLRVTMNLELGAEDVVDMAKQRLPQIRNCILMTLPSKTYEDIHTVAGKTALRDEIMTGFNDILPAGSITNIYFTEFVIQ